jgi:hypothetical protein
VGNTSGRNLQGVRSVYVPVAKNTSLEPDLQMTVTNAIIRRFNSDGTLEVNQNSNADSELDVTITNVQHTAVRSSTSDILVTAQYQLTIQATATYVNRRLGRKIFENAPSPAAPPSSPKAISRKANARPSRWPPTTWPTTPSSSSPKAGKRPFHFANPVFGRAGCGQFGGDHRRCVGDVFARGPVANGAGQRGGIVGRHDGAAAGRFTQWAAPVVSVTMTGRPSARASMVVREKVSIREGQTTTRARRIWSMTAEGSRRPSDSRRGPGEGGKVSSCSVARKGRSSEVSGPTSTKVAAGKIGREKNRRAQEDVGRFFAIERA